MLRKVDELHPGSVDWFPGARSIVAPPELIKENVLRSYLGKELPYASRGYRSYCEAQDISP